MCGIRFLDRLAREMHTEGEVLQKGTVKEERLVGRRWYTRLRRGSRLAHGNCIVEHYLRSQNLGRVLPEWRDLLLSCSRPKHVYDKLRVKSVSGLSSYNLDT